MVVILRPQLNKPNEFKKFFIFEKLKNPIRRSWIDLEFNFEKKNRIN